MILGIDASNIRAGGGLTHLSELLAAADPARSGITDVVVWAGGRTLQMIADRPWLQKRTHAWLERGALLRTGWQVTRLAAACRNECDILLVPGGSYAGTFRPYVAISQNLLPFCPVERARFGWSRMRLKLELLACTQSATFRRANGCVFLTEAARRIVQSEIGTPLPPSTVVPHGISPVFRRHPEAQRPIESYTDVRPFRCLYVSIVDVYKHQSAVAEALVRLRDQGRPITLDLVGPAYPPALSRLAQTLRRIDPTGRCVNYRGAVPFAQLPAIYHKADLFIFASSCENMPNILLEAMAAGLPIACSNREPMPEILGDDGVYFHPDDPASIAAAVESLLIQPDRREKLAAAGFARSAAYSWRRCSAETLGFIETIARGHRMFVSGGRGTAGAQSSSAQTEREARGAAAARGTVVD